MRRDETVQLPFLGSRNYLQGTTLFSSLWSFVPGDAEFSFKVPRFIRSDVIRVVAQTADEAKPSDWDAILTWKQPAASGMVTASAATGSASPLREPFDEESIVKLGTFSKDAISCSKRSPYPLVPTIVALQKAYLLRNVRDGSGGQWIFTRLDLSTLPSDTAGLRLDSMTFAAGQTVCRSRVRLSGRDLGDLYFAWIVPN